MRTLYKLLCVLACLVPSIAFAQLAALPVGPAGAAGNGQTITLGAGVGAALANPVASSGGVAVTVANDAQLSALSSTYAPQVLRSGFAVLGDSPPVVFTSSGSACSLNAGAGDGGSQVPSSDGKCWIGSYSGKVDVTDFGADKTGVADSAPAINAAAAAAQTAALDVYAPSGTYHVKSALNLGSTSTAANNECLRGDGWETIFDVSPDFSTSATGIIIPAISTAPANVQFCVRDVHVRYHQPPDLAVATTAASGATATTITVSSATGIVVGDYVYDTTHSGAIVPNFPTTTNGGTIVASIVGNVVTLSQAIASPGVSLADTINFAQPRANFTALSTGCSLTPGAPGCKYPWAVYNNGMQNFHLDHVMIEAAWDGVYQRGQTYYINDVYVGALDQGLNQDGGHNFPQLTNFELWNGFGLGAASAAGPAFSQNYYDGNVVCANLGASDGLSSASLQCWTGKLNLTANWSFGQFANLMLDGTFADLSVAPSGANQWVQIANLYQSGGQSPETVANISVSSGKVYIGKYHAVSAQRRPIISVTGGEVHVESGYINAGLSSNQYALSVSAGLLDVRNTIFDAASNCVGNIAGFAQQSSTGVLQLVNDQFTTTCSGLPGVTIGADTAGTKIAGLQWGPWSFTGPTSFASGPVGLYASFPHAISSGSSDTQRLTDTAILWASNSGAAKAESIYGCSANNAGATLAITDGYGDAGTNPIIITPQGGTIDGGSTFKLTSNKASVSLICDGASNWIASAQQASIVTIVNAQSPYTYTPSSWATTVDVYLYGPGGAGGGGALQATSTACSGGGGGAGGGFAAGTFSAASLGASVTVTVGAGGVGGAAATVNSTAGSAGVNATQQTNFGGFLYAFNGGSGAGGQLAAASGGGGAASGGSGGGAASGSTAGTGGYGAPGGGSGGAGSNASGFAFSGSGAGSDATGNAYAGGASLYAASAGGSGGGITSGNVANSGGAGGWAAISTNFVAGGSGAGANGNAGAANKPFNMHAGSGAAGGAASLTAAFAGGVGGLPGGGGGGGGCARNGGTAAAGGNGGAGLAILVERN